MMRLYDYFRSTAAYRVRIALGYKGINYDALPVNLVKDGGEQFSDNYTEINPQQLVPALTTDEGVLSQSLAILEYIEEKYPTPALLPTDPFTRAQVRSMALLIACDMHPLNNLRVLTYLKQQLSVNDEQKLAWYHHWLKRGFDAIEARLDTEGKMEQFCYGDSLSLADVCLIPQLYNAKRFEFDLASYPRICAIDEASSELAAFKDAYPVSPDA